MKFKFEGLSSYLTCLCPLSKTSIGGENPMPLTNIDAEVFNFDGVTEEYIKKNSIKHTHQPDSCDALYIACDDNHRICLIEFKRGKINKKSNNLRNKAYASLLILTDILETTISTTRTCISLFLVYEQHDNPIDGTELENLLAKRAGEPFVRFGLQKFKGIYFNEIHTIDKNDFDDYFKKHWVMDAE